MKKQLLALMTMSLLAASAFAGGGTVDSNQTAKVKCVFSDFNGNVQQTVVAQLDNQFKKIAVDGGEQILMSKVNGYLNLYMKGHFNIIARSKSSNVSLSNEGADIDCQEIK